MKFRGKKYEREYKTENVNINLSDYVTPYSIIKEEIYYVMYLYDT